MEQYLIKVKHNICILNQITQYNKRSKALKLCYKYDPFVIQMAIILIFFSFGSQATR